MYENSSATNKYLVHIKGISPRDGLRSCLLDINWRAVAWASWWLKSAASQLFVQLIGEIDSNETAKPYITAPLWWKPPAADGFCHKGTVIEIIPKSWLHHESFHIIYLLQALVVQPLLYLIYVDLSPGVNRRHHSRQHRQPPHGR